MERPGWEGGYGDFLSDPNRSGRHGEDAGLEESGAPLREYRADCAAHPLFERKHGPDLLTIGCESDESVVRRDIGSHINEADVPSPARQPF